jgi:hypothetical protein
MVFTKRILQLLLIISTVQGGVQPACAHNGQIALSYPVTGIVVDASFSDWPTDLPRYPI